VFALAVALFTVASLACGLALSLPAFVAARLLQGAAAAFMSPVGRIVVLEETPKAWLLQAIGTLTWPALVAPVIGPVIGGAIIEVASWRWIFLLNVPIGIAGVLLVLRYIPQRLPTTRKPFDGAGFALTGVALAALVVGLTRVGEPGDALASSLGLVAFGSLLGLLAVRHARRTPAPLLSLAPVAVPTFFHASLGAGLWARIANVAVTFLLPLMFQLAFGMSALRAGALILFYMAGNLLVKAVTIAAIERFGFRGVLVVNGVLCAATLVACGMLGPDSALPLVAAVLFVAGASRSMHLGAITALAFVDVGTQQRAGASALATMLMQLCQAFAVAGATTALTLVRVLRGGQALTLFDFRLVLYALAAIMLLSALDARKLARGNGGVASAAT